MFTHVIQTRFNIATPGRDFKLRTQPGWLESRFEIFERYCFPSVAAQSSKDFKWIIYFDKDTPDDYRRRIEKLQERFPFIAYYTGLFQTEGWSRAIREEVHPLKSLLMTTRLDNDDALARNFVERLHAEVTARNCEIGCYNFRHGFIRHDNAVFSLSHDRNAYFSVLEPNDTNARTSYSIKHMEMHDWGPVFQIEGEPAWIQLVHANTISNHKVRGRRVDPDVVAHLFAGGMSEGLVRPSLFERVLDRLFWYPLRTIRDTLLNLMRDTMRKLKSRH